MMDIQVLIKEAIEQVKDLETCGVKGALAKYLQDMYIDNEKMVQVYIGKIIIHRIMASYNIEGTYQENFSKISEDLGWLNTYINSNPTLYKYAVDNFEDILKKYVEIMEASYDIVLTEKDVINVRKTIAVELPEVMEVK